MGNKDGSSFGSMPNPQTQTYSNSNFSNNYYQSQPTAFNSAPISSVPTRKSKKGLIIAILVILLLAGGGFAAWKLISNNSGQGQANSSAGQYLNQYINMITTGQATDDKIEIDSLNLPESYAEQKIGADKEYFENLNEILKKFDESYQDNVTDDIHSYYYDFAKIETLTEENVMKIYIEEGNEAANTKVNDIYNVVTSNSTLNDYIVAKKKMAVDTITLLQILEEGECIKDGQIDSICGSTLEGYQEYIDDYGENFDIAFSAKTKLKSNAVNALVNLYRTINNENNTESVNE